MDSTELREEIGRVFESGALHSAVLRRILEYLGEVAADGREDPKEYTIGVEALGKSESYDPQRDSTVRVQVGKLRQKLDEYYRQQGAAHRVHICLPKGTFRLQLECKPRRLKILAMRTQAPRVLILALIGLLIGFFAYSLGARRSMRTSTELPRGGWTPELRLLWQPIVGNGMPIVVSFDLAMTVEMPPWRFRNPNINDPEELAASREWQELSNKLGHPTVRTAYQYVGFGVAHGTFLLSQFLAGQRLRPLLKRSTVLSWEDIANCHLIFIGVGKTAKIRQILRRGDFQWDSSKVTNLKPQPGEPAEFHAIMDAHTGDYREQYALISMVPGFDENTRVLVLGGGTSEGDWAVVEYVTVPDHVRDLVRHLKTTSGDLPKAFQVVVRIKYESLVPISIDYVTHHVLSIPAGLQREPQPK
jgi:hypothetical protein